MRITRAQKKAINEYARRTSSGIFAYCEADTRIGKETGECDDGCTYKSHLNLAFFGKRSLTDDGSAINGTDLDDFVSVLGRLNEVEDHPSGITIVDFYVYTRERVGGDTSLDSDVQALWEHGKLVACHTSGGPTVTYFGEPI